MNDYTKNVVMHCPVCGNDQFENLDEIIGGDFSDAQDDTRFRCADCKLIFSKAELIEENQESIELAIDEVKDAVIKEFEKKLKKMFK